MGKKGSWFSKVKKVFSIESKEITDQNQKPKKSKKKWFGKQKELFQNPQSGETCTSVSVPSYPDNVKFAGAHNEQSIHAVSIAAFAAESASNVARLTSMSRYVGKTKEEVAAIRIQTSFRGYTARRALRALKGLVRLKSMINSQFVQRQATTTLHYMQTLAHVQSQIRARRNRLSEENLALKRQLIQKHEKELQRMRSFGGEDWNDSQQSKEKIEERLVSKKQATIRRERALAYAYSHQTLKNALKPDKFTFLDVSNPQWGWSWLERWIAAQPWKNNHSISDAELNSSRGSMKSSSARKLSVGIYTRTDSSLGGDSLTVSSLKVNQPMYPQSPISVPTKTPSSSGSRKIKSANTKVSDFTHKNSRNAFSSSQSEKYRTQSVERLVSTPSAPSYMAPTESVKARSRYFSLIGCDNKKSANNVSSSIGSYPKRLSFAASSAPSARRHAASVVFLQ